MSRADERESVPRAMIHRRILDVAAESPNASLAAIADEVSGASSGLVERVLDKYGDPANTQPAPSSGDGDATDESGTASATDSAADSTEDAPDEQADGETVATNSQDDGDTDSSSDQADGDSEVTTAASEGQSDEQVDDDGADPSDNGDATMDTNGNGHHTNGTTAQKPAEISLSAKQRRTLQAVYERPDASQGDIAEELDVTRATVSRRLSAIPGFEWDDRQAFATTVFGDDEAAALPGDSDGAASGTDDPSNSVSDVGTAEIRETLADINQRLSAVEAGESAGDQGTDAEDSEAPASLPPELAHKVIHACMNSDRITEDEEITLLQSLMER